MNGDVCAPLIIITNCKYYLSLVKNYYDPNKKCQRSQSTLSLERDPNTDVLYSFVIPDWARKSIDAD